ncbi:MASE1 domain-containing protein [Methyloversatilis thermotolerans]|uniref:MASE1 domain-containing protein n=1 Tax=Methyloversatilis thermotolerans TaxID=1346290 RepID=UPI00039A4166|nr:MASE1 domain-containing protein [Methyloversatilis thermotolerans]
MSTPQSGLQAELALSPEQVVQGIRHLWIVNLLIAVAYCMLAALSLQFRDPVGGELPMWAPMGLGLFALLKGGVRWLPGVAFGALTAAVLSGHGLIAGAITASGQIVAPCIGAFAMRRFGGRPHELLERTDGAFKLIAVIYLIAVPSALCEVAAQVLAHGLSSASWFDAFSCAWLADALGCVIVLLPMLAWETDSPLSALWRRPVEQCVVTCALLGLIAATFFGLVHLPDPMLQLYTMLPLVVWVALRFPPRVGWAAYVLGAMIAMAGTVQGLSPFIPHPMRVQMLALHGLIMLTAATALFIGAAMAEKRLARRTLREREAHFRALTMLSSDWHWELDADLRYHRLPDGLTGVHFGDAALDGHLPWEIPGEEALTQPWGLLRQTLERHEPFRDFLSRRRDGGRSRYLASSGEPVFDATGAFCGYRGVSRDITAEMLAREALREEEFRLRALVDALPELIVLKDRHLRWRLANRALLETRCLKKVAWLGTTSEELAAHLPSIADSLRHNHALAEKVRRERVPHFEEQVIDLAGNDPRIYEVAIIPLTDDDGDFTGLVSVRRDVTDQREAARMQAEHVENVRSHNDELERRVGQRTAALESAIKELEAFSYSVSHDLRAPLRALDGFSRLLVEDYGDLLDEQGREYLSRIRRNSQRMGELIDDLLELSRVSRAEVHRSLVNLSDIARDVIGDLDIEAPGRRVQWVIPEGLWCDADPGLARVVIENLLRNAWKFSRQQPEARVEMGQTVLEGQPGWFVRDNGAGFDMAYVGRLFSPFQRLHNSRDYEGSGIGLAIVQRAVRLHGGHVAATGEPGQGACFSFSLGAADTAMPGTV